MDVKIFHSVILLCAFIGSGLKYIDLVSFHTYVNLERKNTKDDTTQYQLVRVAGNGIRVLISGPSSSAKTTRESV